MFINFLVPTKNEVIGLKKAKSIECLIVAGL